MPSTTRRTTRTRPPRLRADDRLVLDTHILIETAEGRTERIGPRARAAIESAAAERRLLVSAISLWEIGMLQQRGRLALTMPMEQWVDALLEGHGLTIEPIDHLIALDAPTLPWAHRDPADRLIVSTARRAGVLLTRDAAMLAFAEAGHVRAFDARP